MTNVENLPTNTPSERLKRFVTSQFKSNVEFADLLGIRPQSLTSYLGSGKRSVFGAKYLSRLRELGLNIDWYLTGEGEMLSLYQQKNVSIDDVIVRLDRLERHLHTISIQLDMLLSSKKG